MLRVSKEELAERWAMTYRLDGYQVRADRLPGHDHPHTTSGVKPDLEAEKGDEQVLVYIIDSPEALEDLSTRTDLQALTKVHADGARLHVIVAAECAHVMKERLEEWGVEADLVHVT